jgi:PAS domain S-box-containing protein
MPGEFAAIFTDVTERKKTEIALEQQAMLLDLSSDAIFAWELDGAITYWNSGAETLYAFSPEEAVGQVSHDLLGTAHPQGFAPFRAALERDGKWAGELTHTAKNGRTVVVETRQQVIDVGGRQLVLETNRDVTERKRMEAEREELPAEQQQLNEELATANEELRAQADELMAQDEELRTSYEPAMFRNPRIGKCMTAGALHIVHAALLTACLRQRRMRYCYAMAGYC